MAAETPDFASDHTHTAQPPETTRSDISAIVDHLRGLTMTGMDDYGDGDWTPADLRAWRKRLGKTRADAAALLASPLSSYRKWEEGRRPVRPIIARLARMIERYGGAG